VAGGLGRARAAAARGDVDGAVRRYEEVVREARDPFRRAQALFESAQALDAAGRHADARPLYERVRREYPDEGDLAAQAAAALDGP